MDIKKAGVKDYERILEIWNDTSKILDFSTNKYTKKDLANIAKNKDQLVLIAKIGKQIIGTLHAEIKPGYCKVNKLVIDTIYRNKGVGTKMLKEIEKISRKKKCKKIIFLTYEENEIFKDFLSKNKYEETKITMFSRKL